MDDLTKDNTLLGLWNTSYLAGSNATYLEQLYESYLLNPAAVDPQWRDYFDSLPSEDQAGSDVSHADIRNLFRKLARHGAPAQPQKVAPSAPAALNQDQLWKQIRVLQLINAFRFRGHQYARLDPLELEEHPEIPELHLEHYGLSDSDLDIRFDTGSLAGQASKASLREVIDILTTTYCGTIGAEYMHITETAEKRWIQTRLENSRCIPSFDTDVKQRLLDRINAAEGLERFLHTKYIGQKRFSLEGAECLIPMLDELIHRGGKEGVQEIVIGMAHRGRLNVLVNIMGKTPAELFLEFEGKSRGNGHSTGDVKYHQGCSCNIKTSGGPVHVTLAFNPSHLEIVDPVVEGSARARQERRNDKDGGQVVPVLIHGDAAFAGQGVVMETINMSQSRGYSTKGTVHIIVNNQIGFTTSYQRDARSTLYCTDVAKMVNTPVFHVNGDDPEAVAYITQLAFDYRMAFRKDVVIDLVCYRRHGHSEADEPFSTQPLMYKKIKDHPTTVTLYSQKLIAAGNITTADFAKMTSDYRQALEAGDSMVPELIKHDQASYSYDEAWKPYIDQEWLAPVDTAVQIDVLRDLAQQLAQLPQAFVLHSNVSKIFDNRRKMAAGALPVDWGFAEIMAYATLLKDNFNVRLSGQDSGRGTFFHRHSVVYDQKTGEAYIPLRNLIDTNANFLVINSLLSEEAVLGFEYGYATTDPKTLVIWEAQFGDFANNAQVVIDQFISAGEQKWNRLCGLVMLLPHGYEGQGPEHSSARLERYLQLCAQHNMQVCVPTKPAQIFHLLRRQMLMATRKPLIVIAPKSLLRHRLAVSSLEDLSTGSFQQIIPEIDELNSDDVKRIILCSGKVFYDLLEKRRKDERNDVAIIRIEQLYPFPKDELQQELERYRHAEQLIWCQEEPMNQGAWYSSQHNMQAILSNNLSLSYAGRPSSAAPAVGNVALHIKELHAFLDEAFSSYK
jgi:2-oxoglutarate dehydrogenase E1 component